MDALEQAKARALQLSNTMEGEVESYLAGPPRLNPFEATVTEELTTEILGSLSESFLGKRRPGTKLARATLKDGDARQRAQWQSGFRERALRLLDSLEWELGSVEKVVPARSLASVRGAMAKARAAKRPDTILRRGIEAAHKVAALEKRKEHNDDSHELKALQQLERTLRDCIVRNLSPLSPNWWQTRVPADIRAAAEARKAKDDRPWPWSASKASSEMDFLDFAGYSKIISQRDNWREVFESIFRDQEIIRAKLRELEPIRNAIAHSRTLAKDDRTKLQLYASELARAVGAR